MLRNFQNTTVIFTDGASKGNPGPGGWGAIIATPEGEIMELGGSQPSTTNNRMELTAAIQALRVLKQHSGTINIFTDSLYLIRGITEWIGGWQKKNWKTAEGHDVANTDLWKNLSHLVFREKPHQVFWHHVRSHVGIAGNERADQIATQFAQEKPIRLYHGSLLQYDVAIFDLSKKDRS